MPVLKGVLQQCITALALSCGSHRRHIKKKEMVELEVAEGEICRLLVYSVDQASKH